MMKKFLGAVLSMALTVTTAFGAFAGAAKDVKAEEYNFVYDVATLTVVCPPDNSIVMLWTVPDVEVTAEYSFNVYLNGQFVENTTETGTVINRVFAGANTVTVKCVYNGIESAGVTKYALVRGVTYFEDETTTTTTTTTTTEIPSVEVPSETTTAPTCILPTIADEDLLEVIGLVVTAPADNTIGVVWGQDEARMNGGYTYNVYVNDVKVLSNVGCAGTAEVKVTACCQASETAGVAQTVEVTGDAVETETESETVAVIPETETETVANDVLEVIGLVVNATNPNQIGVVWGQDAERMNAGYTYNVYVNGELELSEVPCAYYVLSSPSGDVDVTVKAILNGVESAGVTQTVAVAQTVYGPASVTTVCPPDNTIIVFWTTPYGVDTTGYTYNVYLNGKLVYENLTETGATIQNVYAGANSVTVTCVLNGVESWGTSKYALVRNAY